MITAAQDHATYWVCEDCHLTHHGYDEHELGSAPDRKPLNRISDSAEVTAGLVAEEHDDECPVWLGDPSRPDVPVREAECDCERIEFTWTSCDGCGSTLGGTREALTVWVEQ